MSTNINAAAEFRVIGLPGIGMIENGDNLVAEIGSALERNAITLEPVSYTHLTLPTILLV